MSRRIFPKGFFWGVATSAYQIEGAATEGGRGESVWDRFARTPGKITDGSDGAIACDHYHRWQDDVLLLKQLGLNAYRFSVGWSRVMPRGRGVPNSASLDFYEALVDLLLAAGIRPFVTLNHWDLPQALQDEGGWSARSTCEAFTGYAEAVARRLGDRVADWTTHNEPWCIAHLGWQTGDHAPGMRDPLASLRAAHHLLLSHGQAVPVLRRDSRGARVGIVLNLTPGYPASPSEADAEATRRFDGSFNRWYLDPLYRGAYPADAIADRVRDGHLAGPDLPFVAEGDLAVIATPTDHLGINYYSRAVLRSEVVPESGNAPRTEFPAPAAEHTEMGWEVYPRGLHDLLVRVHRDYRPARIHLTEIGAAFSDAPDGEGRISDARRIRFVRDHLLEAGRAIDEGVPVVGCFVWSLIDNFEWQHGYTKRFGLVWVDFASLQRTPKDSALWYRDVAAANAVDDAFALR